MICFGKQSQGAIRRRAVGDLGEKAPYFKSEWMETGHDPILSPTVFLIEQPPGSQIPTHFHRQNEFQVVVRGSGTIGQHALAPVSIHYAGAYSGYGPVTASDSGLAYFTIRPAFDNAGAITIDRAKKELVRGPKRQAYAEHVSPRDAQLLAGLDHVVRSSLLDTTDDDLSVERLAIPAGRTTALASANSGCGVFHMVVSGSAWVAGEQLALWETVFVSSDESELVVEAGSQGVEIISMQMPQTDEPYRRTSV